MPSFRQVSSNTAGARALIAVGFLLLLTMTGCSEASSVLAPASFAGREIATLFWVLVGVSAVIFFSVVGLLLFSVLRFRPGPGRPEPNQVHGNLRLEIVWTILPAIILAGIFVAMFQTMNAVTLPQTGALKVVVTGHQWWWEVSYPEQEITTATDIHVPAGQPVEIELISADVLHSFWVPELAGKIDAFPERSTWVRFKADNPGIFRGRCAEFCGAQHANMGFLVIAETSEQFEEWVESLQKPAPAPASDPARRGARAFSASGCGGCHTIEGTQSQGKTGPNLTHFGSRQTVAALTMDNTPDNLTLWLGDPQSIKPSTKMTTMQVSAETIRDLVAYLEELK